MIKASYSSAGFVDRGIEAALDVIAATGFEQVEILGQEPHVLTPPTGQTLVEFNQRLCSRGLKATVHAPLTTNVLGAPQEQWRKEKVQVLASFLYFAAGIEAKEMVVHPVPNPVFVPNSTDPGIPKLIEEAVHRSLNDLVPVSEQTGVRILLENLPYNCDFPFLTTKELKCLVDLYPIENVGLLIDTGHSVLLKQDPVEEILLAGDCLYGVHLQDSDGKYDYHWLPGEGIVDWQGICQSLKTVNFEGSWIFEINSSQRNETPEELCKKAFAMIDWFAGLEESGV